MGFWKATEEYLMPFVLISREQTLLILKVQSGSRNRPVSRQKAQVRDRRAVIS